MLGLRLLFQAVLLQFLLPPVTLFATDNKTISIATGQWPPYIDKNTKNLGCVAQLIKDSFHSQGYKVAFTFTSWTGAYERAKKGSFDATAYWFDRSDRRRDFIFSKQYITIEKNYFYRNTSTSPDYRSWHELQGKTIIINKNYTYNQLFWDKIKKHGIQIYSVEDEISSLNMLHLNRGDFIILSERTAEFYIKKLPIQTARYITRHSIAPIISKGYLLFSRARDRSIEFKQAFDSGLALKLKDPDYKAWYIKECSEL